MPLRTIHPNQNGLELPILTPDISEEYLYDKILPTSLTLLILVIKISTGSTQINDIKTLAVTTKIIDKLTTGALTLRTIHGG